MQDLRTVGELTITDKSNVSDLSFMNDLPNITKMTIKDYNGSLKGIEKAYKLTYLYFDNKNGKIKIDYTGVKGLATITELYFIMPTDEEIEKLFTEMSKSDYTKLKTVKICGGITSYDNDGARVTPYGNSTFSNKGKENNSIFELLTTKTKESINFLELGSNKISAINLKGFSELSTLILCNNDLLNVPEIELKSYSKVDLGRNKISDFSLKNGVKISKLYIDNNNLTNLKGILNHSVTNCWATGMKALDFTILTETERSSLASINLYIDETYALAFPTAVTTIPTKTTDEQFEQISNSTVVQTLNLSGCDLISDSLLQEVLPTLTSLKKLNLDGTNITSLNCIENLSIIALSIRNTNVNDLTPIIDKKIGLFRLNNADNIISEFNKLDKNNKEKYKKFFNNIVNSSGGGTTMSGFAYYGTDGLCLDSSEDLAKLVKSMEITNLKANYENSACTGQSLDLSDSIIEKITLLDHLDKVTKTILPSGGSAEKPLDISLERVGGNIECLSKNFNLRVKSFSNNFSLTIKNSSTDSVSVGALEICSDCLNSSWNGVNIEKLILKDNAFWATDYGKKSGGSYSKTSNIKILTKDELNLSVNQLYLDNVKYTSLSELDKFTMTTDIHSWYNGLTSFGDFFEKNTNITKLYLTHNNIASLDGLENANSLEYLDLSYNLLGNNYTSTKDGQNKSVTEVISKLSNLKWVSLEGNPEITDFSYLENAGFKNIGNNVFTK